MFYSKEQIEQNILFTALLLAKAKPINVSKRESPDFEVSLSDGRTVYVEVTQLGSDAARQNIVFDLNGGINEWISEDAAASERIRGWIIIFQIATTPNSAAAERAFSELQDFIRTANFNDYDLDKIRKLAVIAESFPTLRSLGATVSCRQRQSLASVLVKPMGGAVPGPWDDMELATSRIDEKRRRAMSWTVRPMWLVIDISSATIPGTTMDLLASSPPFIDPFSEVIFCAGLFGKDGLIVRSSPNRMTAE
jgi:hypothetical protein